MSLKGGATVQEIQKIMRHADLPTTMGYAHHVSREMHDAVKRLPNLQITP